MIRLRTLLSVLALLVAQTTHAQELIMLNSACSYFDEPLDSQIYGFASDQEAEAALGRIMGFTGLPANFIIRAANVPNAAAVIQPPKRLILYNQQFMQRVKSSINDWAALSIVAHEIGHHLAGHTLTNDGSRPPTELEADIFSGYVLGRMGATLDQAQAAMKAFGSAQGSSTHPPQSARLAAIANGWYKATNESPAPNTRPSPIPSSGPTQVPQPGPITVPGSSQPIPSSGPVPALRVVFPADPVTYYVLSDDVIVGVHPMTGQTIPVGRKLPPISPNFAWMYGTAVVTYGVDHQGRVWAQDPSRGQVFQVGYVAPP